MIPTDQADGNWKKFLFQGVSCLRNEGKMVSEQIHVCPYQEAEEDKGYGIATNSNREVGTEREDRYQLFLKR